MNWLEVKGSQKERIIYTILGKQVSQGAALR